MKLYTTSVKQDLGDGVVFQQLSEHYVNKVRAASIFVNKDFGYMCQVLDIQMLNLKSILAWSLISHFKLPVLFQIVILSEIQHQMPFIVSPKILNGVESFAFQPSG